MKHWWQWKDNSNYRQTTDKDCCASCHCFVGQCIPHPVRGYDDYDRCNKRRDGFIHGVILFINKPGEAAKMTCDEFEKAHDCSGRMDELLAKTLVELPEGKT
jgi:hypothetical protein